MSLFMNSPGFLSSFVALSQIESCQAIIIVTDPGRGSQVSDGVVYQLGLQKLLVHHVKIDRHALPAEYMAGREGRRGYRLG
jgi:hypothetical protein